MTIFNKLILLFQGADGRKYYELNQAIKRGIKDGSLIPDHVYHITLKNAVSPEILQDPRLLELAIAVENGYHANALEKIAFSAIKKDVKSVINEAISSMKQEKEHSNVPLIQEDKWEELILLYIDFAEQKIGQKNIENKCLFDGKEYTGEELFQLVMAHLENRQFEKQYKKIIKNRK